MGIVCVWKTLRYLFDGHEPFVKVTHNIKLDWYWTIILINGIKLTNSWKRVLGLCVCVCVSLCVFLSTDNSRRGQRLPVVILNSMIKQSRPPRCVNEQQDLLMSCKLTNHLLCGPMKWSRRNSELVLELSSKPHTLLLMHDYVTCVLLCKEDDMIINFW